MQVLSALAHVPPWTRAIALASSLAILASCSRERRAPEPCGAGASLHDEISDGDASAEQRRCVLLLHGKGGEGAPSAQRGALRYVCPSGNASAWGGRQWRYYPERAYREVRAIVAKSLQDEGCTQAIIHGFSNGATAAAKLFCQGESFEGRVRGYIVDDPVPDHAVDACSPAPSVRVALYWTAGLTQPIPGWKCSEADWTCQGGSTVGIQAFAAALQTSIQRSPHAQHQPYVRPPEYVSWW